ncbi:unnamed protein product [Amoebophrya sp. A25]|nr:unnamed protein product [Amoebophrya sp. A25]|eukprot:GSA25T00010722001.1
MVRWLCTSSESAQRKSTTTAVAETVLEEDADNRTETTAVAETVPEEDADNRTARMAQDGLALAEAIVPSATNSMNLSSTIARRALAAPGAAAFQALAFGAATTRTTGGGVLANSGGVLELLGGSSSSSTALRGLGSDLSPRNRALVLGGLLLMASLLSLYVAAAVLDVVSWIVSLLLWWAVAFESSKVANESAETIVEVRQIFTILAVEDLLDEDEIDEVKELREPDEHDLHRRGIEKQEEAGRGVQGGGSPSAYIVQQRVIVKSRSISGTGIAQLGRSSQGQHETLVQAATQRALESSARRLLGGVEAQLRRRLVFWVSSALWCTVLLELPLFGSIFNLWTPVFLATLQLLGDTPGEYLMLYVARPWLRFRQIGFRIFWSSATRSSTRSSGSSASSREQVGTLNSNRITGQAAISSGPTGNEDQHFQVTRDDVKPTAPALGPALKMPVRKGKQDEDELLQPSTSSTTTPRTQRDRNKIKIRNTEPPAIASASESLTTPMLAATKNLQEP